MAHHYGWEFASGRITPSSDGFVRLEVVWKSSDGRELFQEVSLSVNPTSFDAIENEGDMHEATEVIRRVVREE